MKKFTRREFIGHSAKITAGIAGCSLFSSNCSGDVNSSVKKSQAVLVSDEGVLKTSGAIDPDIVQRMMDSGIRRLTGEDNIGEAWKSLFPNITNDKVISIKVNCIARNGLSSHPEVAGSIINGLKEMIIDGVSFLEENIIIWDRSDYELEQAGFLINKGNTGVKCFGTRTEISETGHTDGYSIERYNVGGSQQCLSKIITEMSDYLINLSVLKNHPRAGVTLSLKNHYGSCHYPGFLHNDSCRQFIPALNSLRPILEKQVISICDALYGCVSNGPVGAPQVRPKSLIMSTDPVAHDSVGRKLLQDLGSPAVERAYHIAEAAAGDNNLGIENLSEIDLIKINT